MSADEDYKQYKAKKQVEFFDKYPQLFPDGEPYCGFYCDFGWWPLLKRLCFDISTELTTANREFEKKSSTKPKPKVIVAQVKEKFGGLRFYVDSENITEEFSNKIQTLIQTAEEESLNTCEKCGNPGEKALKGFWVKTLCENCKKY